MASKTLKLRGWAPLYGSHRKKIGKMLRNHGVNQTDILKIHNAIDERRDKFDQKFRTCIKQHPKWKELLLAVGTDYWNDEISAIAEKVEVTARYIETERGHGAFRVDIGQGRPIVDIEF